MNCLVTNFKQDKIIILFETDITKISILNIFGALELERQIKTGNRIIVDRKLLTSGQYLIQFIRNGIVIDSLKMALKM